MKLTKIDTILPKNPQRDYEKYAQITPDGFLIVTDGYVVVLLDLIYLGANKESLPKEKVYLNRETLKLINSRNTKDVEFTETGVKITDKTGKTEFIPYIKEIQYVNFDYFLSELEFNGKHSCMIINPDHIKKVSEALPYNGKMQKLLFVMPSNSEFDNGCSIISPIKIKSLSTIKEDRSFALINPL